MGQSRTTTACELGEFTKGQSDDALRTANGRSFGGMVLVGLDPDMPVEIEPGILLAAKNVGDLRALTAWPPDLRLIRPGDPRLPESVVTVERA